MTLYRCVLCLGFAALFYNLEQEVHGLEGSSSMIVMISAEPISLYSLS